MTRIGKDIQIIIQTEQTTGGFRCEGFCDFPALGSYLIVIVTAGTPDTYKWANQLRKTLITTLRYLSPADSRVANIRVPCGGAIPGTHRCHAHDAPSTQKLLVLVGDSRECFAPSYLFSDWNRGDPAYRVLPIFPAGAPVARLLSHTTFQNRNAAFWSKSIDEVTFTVITSAGLTAEDRRVFISYYRPDTAELAEQLFDGLSHANFDVYLDRFRTPPAVDFQRRIEQELADKATVLVLESRNLGMSKWCKHEISMAKALRLGLMGLRMPGVKQQLALSNSMALLESDLALPSRTTLEKAALTKVLDGVRQEHDRMLVYRRMFVRQSFENALRLQVPTPHIFTANRLIHVRSRGGARYAIWFTPRTPELADFHATDTSKEKVEKGIVIGTRVTETVRWARVDWLSQMSGVECTDEGKLDETARRVAEGTL